MSSDHEKFMALAIEEARAAIQAGERPFGSVVVQDGEVIGRGHNIVNSTLDPTAHAEVMAIRNATARLKISRLSGGTLYTSCDPCPMCAGATLYAGIDTLVIGARFDALKRSSGNRYDLKEYNAERLVEMTGLKLEVIGGVLQKEAEAVFLEYKNWDEASPNVLRSN